MIELPASRRVKDHGLPTPAEKGRRSATRARAWLQQHAPSSTPSSSFLPALPDPLQAGHALPVHRLAALGPAQALASHHCCRIPPLTAHMLAVTPSCPACSLGVPPPSAPLSPAQGPPSVAAKPPTSCSRPPAPYQPGIACAACWQPAFHPQPGPCQSNPDTLSVWRLRWCSRWPARPGSPPTPGCHWDRWPGLARGSCGRTAPRPWGPPGCPAATA